MTINTPPEAEIKTAPSPSRYTVPQKYPGVLLPIQKTYLNPNMCCMCGELSPAKTISVQQQYTEFNWGKITHKLTMTFPICAECKQMHNRLKFASTVGYIIGLGVGGGISSLIYEAANKPKNAWWWIVLLTLVVMGICYAISTMLVLKNVPKERHAFYSLISEGKGIRMTFDANQGFVAIGFLSQGFATAFQLANGGMATVV